MKTHMSRYAWRGDSDTCLNGKALVDVFEFISLIEDRLDMLKLIFVHVTVTLMT